jgi:hypothetical protein
MTLQVDDPRPLEAAVLSLIKRYPVAITYEDPRYEYSDDIEDITARVLKNPSASSARFLVPRGGVLQADIEISSDSGQPVSIAATVQGIVNAKNVIPRGGQFRVYQSEDAFHIVPAATRDSKGAWVEQRSILDTPITLSSAEMNGVELIDAILKQVSDGSGVKLGLSGFGFSNELMSHKARVVATGEPARDVLMRTLHSIDSRFTWLLLYDPALHLYVFNLAFAAEPPPSETPLPALPRQGDPTPGGLPFAPRN